MKTITAIFFLVISLQVGTLHADQSDDEARVHFAQGLEFYQQEDYEKAVISFRRAYELKPSVKILYNIGQVENQLEHYAAAYIAYSSYLAESPKTAKDKRRQEVEKEVARLTTLIGKLVIKSEIEGASVQIDSEKVGVLPITEPILVDMGRHEIRVISGVEELYREVIVVAGGQEIEVQIKQPEKPVVSTPVEPPPEAPAATVVAEPRRIWTWIVGGTGAACLIAGGIVGGLSLSQQNELDAVCDDGSCPPSYEDDLKRGKTLSVTADVLFAVGGVALATGIVLFFVEPKLGKKRAESADSGLSVTPVMMTNGGGLVFTGRI